jgi:hypothetical protein
MSINKTLIAIAVAGLTLGATSCRKYLDVNDNPNVAHNVTVTTLLPAAELSVASAIGVDMQVNGAIWSQFWTQSPMGKEYIPFEQYDPKADAYNEAWKNLYAGAENFYQIQNLSVEQHKAQYQAISLIMQAYAFQALTDAWGDVPFKEALKGQYPDGHIVNPAYDSQRVVYRGIIKYIDSAKKLINFSDASHPGADDLIYGGDMHKWMKFANTLKLRILMRMSHVDPVYAQLTMDTLYMSNPQFIGEGDEAVIAYGSGAANNNPLYSELSANPLGGVEQLAASKTCADAMNVSNDYRSAVFFHPLSGVGVVGITQSEYDIALPAGSYSTLNAYTGADINDPASGMAKVVLLSSWESFFLQAEAAARGMEIGNDAQLYYQGIHASFNYYNSALMAEKGTPGDIAYDIYVNGDIANGIPAGFWSVYPAAGTPAQKVRHIITQKWFASAGSQGFESWNEWRRTGYPDFLVSPRNSRMGTNDPLRFLYPASEATTNSNYPGLMPVIARVWWDVL